MKLMCNQRKALKLSICFRALVMVSNFDLLDYCSFFMVNSSLWSSTLGYMRTEKSLLNFSL